MQVSCVADGLAPPFMSFPDKHVSSCTNRRKGLAQVPITACHSLVLGSGLKVPRSHPNPGPPDPFEAPRYSDQSRCRWTSLTSAAPTSGMWTTGLQRCVSCRRTCVMLRCLTHKVGLHRSTLGCTGWSTLAQHRGILCQGTELLQGSDPCRSPSEPHLHLCLQVKLHYLERGGLSAARCLQQLQPSLWGENCCHS